MKGHAIAWLLLAASGCSSSAGMFCQQQSDCRTGLICSKPAVRDGGTADMGPFGVCEPARRGLGETCLDSAECQTPLFCSNEIGMFTGDQRHGTCQPGKQDLAAPPADGAGPVPADGSPPDGTSPPADGGAALDFG